MIMLIALFSITIMPGKTFAMDPIQIEKKKEEVADCIICSDPLVDDTISLHCHADHKFHKNCIAGWAIEKSYNGYRQKHRAACPICKQRLNGNDKRGISGAIKQVIEENKKKDVVAQGVDRIFRKHRRARERLGENVNNLLQRSITPEKLLEIEKQKKELKKKLEREILPKYSSEEEKEAQKYRIEGWIGQGNNRNGNRNINERITQIKEILREQPKEKKKKQPVPVIPQPQSPEELPLLNPEQPQPNQEEMQACHRCNTNIMPELGDRVDFDNHSYHGECLRELLQELEEQSSNPQSLLPSQPQHLNCGVCNNEIHRNLKETACNHQFHTNCLNNHIRQTFFNSCPTCRAEALTEREYNKLLEDAITNNQKILEEDRLKQAAKRQEEERFLKEYNKRHNENKRKEEATKKKREAEQKRLVGQRKKVLEEKAEAHRKKLFLEKKEKERKKRALRNRKFEEDEDEIEIIEEPLRRVNNPLELDNNSLNDDGDNGGNGGWFWPMAKIGLYTSCFIVAIIIANKLLRSGDTSQLNDLEI